MDPCSRSCRRPVSPSWVNTPVLIEAMQRYEQQRLPRSLRLWLQALLELDTPDPSPLLPPHVGP
ncbi:hypothetical protein NZK32_00535 [Cyanobium sp. FGCU-52]|nr:hypothetical protein [Cyanobium sp. FGCU52]